MVYALSEVPSGTVVLVDASIFVYSLLGESEQSAQFIQRCRNEDLAGVTTSEVIGEVCHHLMLKEAMDSGLITRPTAPSLKNKHQAIRGLHKYWELTARLFQWNLAVLASNVSRHRTAQRIRTKYRLLTNDSLVVAACVENDIRSLASRDADFDSIAEITVYSPSGLS
jgi:predicted nucleic acid-binding protein